MCELQKSANSKTVNRHNDTKARVSQIDRDIAKLERKVDKLYDNLDDGIISEQRYKEQLTDTEARISALKSESLTLAENLAKIAETETNATNFLDLIAEYDNIKELDAAILNCLIEQIVVGNKVHLGGHKYSQDITIYFRFVGAV